MSMESGLQPKKLYASVTVPPSGFQTNGQLPRVSRQSHLLTNDKIDIEVKPEAKFLAFALPLRKPTENLRLNV